MRKFIAGCFAVCILAVSLTFTGCSTTETAKEEMPLVRSQTVKMDDARQAANYSGEVRGRYETQAAFQVGGKIVKRNVEPGSAITAGDVLMEIDARDIRQTVTISSAQVDSAQSQLKLAATNLERYHKLYEQGAVSRAQLDQYQSAYEVALAAVRQSSAQYTQGANQLGYSALVADQAGIIASVSAEAGQVVGAGQPVLTIVQDGEREIEINVPENRIEQMQSGQQVDVSFWALPGAIAEGRVREVSPVADKVARTYKVRISLLNPPAGVNLGMTASVAAAVPTSRQHMYIPLAAIYQTGDKPNVWVVNDGVVSLRPVVLGDFGDNSVQVTAGLQHGETIVVAGVQKLREGQKVRL